jgi:hypothetical protein
MADLDYAAVVLLSFALTQKKVTKKKSRLRGFWLKITPKT